MNSVTTTPAPLQLAVVAGPYRPPIVLDVAAQPLVMGRNQQCQITFSDTDAGISRRHAELIFADGAWQLRDLSSSHGTFVNGNRLAPLTPSPLREGDRITLGLFTFRLSRAEATEGTRVLTTQDDRATGAAIKPLPEARTVSSSQRRLNLLIACAGAITQAASEAEIAAAALDALLTGAGFPRAAVLRPQPGGEQVHVLASRGPDTGPPTFSRSLLVAAARGQPVVLRSSDAPAYGQSVMSLDINAAVCVPVIVGGKIDSFVYLDTRADEVRASQGVDDDTASFCQAIARLVGLAFANLHRMRLEQDGQRRRAELSAARDVQRIIMPPPSGRVGGLSYFMRSIPGRDVAGDLFDFITLDQTRVAVLLGDVVGKGVAAGMVMANVQAHLDRLLRESPDPARAAMEVNQLLIRYSDRAEVAHSGSIIMLSLWLGVFDLETRLVRFIDAGHGYWMYRPVGGAVRRVQTPGDVPIGTELQTKYVNDELRLSPGDRLFVFSDGVAEQGAAEGKAFGLDRTVEALTGTGTIEDQTSALVAAVCRHAGAPLEALTGDVSPFADDVTVAAVQVD